jgi:hypothetical protein
MIAWAGEGFHASPDASASFFACAATLCIVPSPTWSEMPSGGIGMPAIFAAFSMSAGGTPSASSVVPSVMKVPKTRLV